MVGPMPETFLWQLFWEKNWKPATDQNEIRFKAADFLLEEQTSGNLFLNSLSPQLEPSLVTKLVAFTGEIFEAPSTVDGSTNPG